MVYGGVEGDAISGLELNCEGLDTVLEELRLRFQREARSSCQLICYFIAANSRVGFNFGEEELACVCIRQVGNLAHETTVGVVSH